MRKLALLIALVLVFSLGRVGNVMADGEQTTKETCTTQYGGQVECHSQTEITHQTVEAGLGENLMVLGGMVGVMALTFLGMAKLTKRVYLLD